MLKIRLQGKIKDIKWFQGMMQNSSELVVTEVSDIYPNKGTNQYYRNYMEVDQSKKRNGGK